MNNRPTTLHLPGHLPFPITITSLLVKPDSQIKKHDGLLVYKFLATVSEDRDGEEDKPMRKEMVEQFDSPWEGVLTEWHVKEGTVVSSSRFGFIPLKQLLTGLVNLLSRLLNHVYMKSRLKIFALFAELIYLCMIPFSVPEYTINDLDEIILEMYLHSQIYPCLMITLMLK
jgi:hypothetical protein